MRYRWQSMPRPSEVPGPLALRDYIREKGLSASQAGRIIHVSNSTFRKWTSAPDSRSYEPIPWACWHMLRLLLNDATWDEVRPLAGQSTKETEQTSGQRARG